MNLPLQHAAALPGRRGRPCGPTAAAVAAAADAPPGSVGNSEIEFGNYAFRSKSFNHPYHQTGGFGSGDQRGHPQQQQQQTPGGFSMPPPMGGGNIIKF